MRISRRVHVTVEGNVFKLQAPEQRKYPLPPNRSRKIPPLYIRAPRITQQHSLVSREVHVLELQGPDDTLSPLPHHLSATPTPLHSPPHQIPPTISTHSSAGKYMSLSSRLQKAMYSCGERCSNMSGPRASTEPSRDGTSTGKPWSAAAFSAAARISGA